MPAVIDATLLRRMISHYAQRRLRSRPQLRQYLVKTVGAAERSLLEDGEVNWGRIAAEAGMDADTAAIRDAIGESLRLLLRDLDDLQRRPGVRIEFAASAAWRQRSRGEAACDVRDDAWSCDAPRRLSVALRAHMGRTGDSCRRLHLWMTAERSDLSLLTLKTWLRDTSLPRHAAAVYFLERAETRYELAAGALTELIRRNPRGLRGPSSLEFGSTRPVLIGWHLPSDFETRNAAQRREILSWVEGNIFPGGTSQFRAWQAVASRRQHVLRFPKAEALARDFGAPGSATELASALTGTLSHRVRAEPQSLDAELCDLIQFKMAAFSEVERARSGVWNLASAIISLRALGGVFGALCLSQTETPPGLGVAPGDLGCGHLVFPQFWDWYLAWRAAGRGFFTSSEVRLLLFAAALARENVGWLRSCGPAAARLKPIAGLITADQIMAVQTDWSAACDRLSAFALSRTRDLVRLRRTHRDPFHAIAPILNAPEPLSVYRSITDEIERHFPDPQTHPVVAADLLRTWLMMRLGMHTGFRQRNLRELLLCAPGTPPFAEDRLARLRRGQLSFDVETGAWVISIPVSAFKNAGSSFFLGRSHRLTLPNLGRLYPLLERYVRTDRLVQIAGGVDPGTLFVKRRQANTRTLEMSSVAFYAAWATAIRQFGIYNPYTGRGVVEGLLPHGPHAIRDVLATHVLKVTGSYEKAGYAIQDTASTTRKHYSRFLPEEKAQEVAEIIARSWRD